MCRSLTTGPFVFTVLLVAFFSCINTGSPNKQQKDTIFLIRELHDTPYAFYHAIFMDTSRKSEYYNYLSDFSFGEFDTATFQQSLDYLRKNKLKPEEKKVNGLPHSWILAYSYKGKYYVYSPSDYYSHYKVRITDTAFIDFSGEGPQVSKIWQYQQLNKNTFRFELSGVFAQKRELTIHIIDPEKGLAVFEDKFNDKVRGSQYYLMVDADRIRNLPIIVNYCATDRQSELDFDTLDYKILIK